LYKRKIHGMPVQPLPLAASLEELYNVLHVAGIANNINKLGTTASSGYTQTQNLFAVAFAAAAARRPPPLPSSSIDHAKTKKMVTPAGE